MTNVVSHGKLSVCRRAAVVTLAAAAALVGCRKEAEKFGYRGCDLDEGEPLYYTAGGGVTNYVPVRVMCAFEKYDFTEDERALVKALGVIDAGATIQRVPTGYVARSKEPWLSTYVKDGVSFFGQTGTVGFLCHPDPDRGVYEVGEVFFSTYHKTLDEARAAMAARRKLFEQNLRPLKYHDFSDSFVAEYRRLKVITVAGARPDGVFACMTNIGDKNREGCGEWLPLDEQQEMLDSYLFSKALAAWNAECKKIGEANHKAMAGVCGDRKLGLFEAVGLGSPSWFPGDKSLYAASASAEHSWAKDDPKRGTVLAETLEKAAAGFGVTFGEVVSNAVDTCCAEYRAEGSGELFDVRVSVAFIDPPPPPPEEEGAEAAEAQSAEAQPAEPLPPRVVISVSATERLIGGRKLPAYPKMGQK